MKIIDNINSLLGESLKSTIEPKAKVKIAASCFASVLLLCSLLAACAPKPSAVSAEQLVRSIYTLPDPDFRAFLDPARRPLYYSQRIVKKAAEAERCYKEKYAMPDLEFDYITIGGDYDMHNLVIALQKENKTAAQVKVTFGKDDYYTELYYHLIATPAGWRIDDVITEKNGSLGGMLQNGC